MPYRYLLAMRTYHNFINGESVPAKDARTFRTFNPADTREVVADPNALYSGAKIDEKTLVPGKNASLGETRYETWLTQPAAQIPIAHPKANAA